MTTSSRADADIASALDYYVDRGEVEAAGRFVDELEAEWAILRTYPGMGSVRDVLDALSEIRGHAMSRFPYVVFYIDRGEDVRIVRVLHMSRDVGAEFAAPEETP